VESRGATKSLIFFVWPTFAAPTGIVAQPLACCIFFQPGRLTAMSYPLSDGFVGKTATLRGFDRVAWFYDTLAGLVFGPALRRAQQAALAALPPGAPHILILGGGTGWVLAEVLRRRPQATVLYLEASRAMLTRAEALLLQQLPTHRAQVEFRHGTQAQLGASETFDVVITFFVLDCIAAADFAPAVSRLYTALRPGGHWLVADFSQPRRWWQRLLLRLMYWFFRYTAGLTASRLPAYLPALQALGLKTVLYTPFFGQAVDALAFSKPPAEPLPGPNQTPSV
jgi:tRNA (cmo5U34)-methyltransferase